MKVLIESYNNITQNTAGGIQGRIKNLIYYLQRNSIEATLFNKWEHKVKDFDILHIFKLNMEDYHLVNYAKNNDIPVVISSVVPLEGAFKIKMNKFICKVLPIHTGYSFMGKCSPRRMQLLLKHKRKAILS